MKLLVLTIRLISTDKKRKSSEEISRENSVSLMQECL